MLKDLQYLINFCHTGSSEIYHALNNKWLPKRQHFSHLGKVTRSQLVVMDFNAGSNLEQTKNNGREGKNQFQFLVSKTNRRGEG